MKILKVRCWDTLQGGRFEYWDSKTNVHEGIFWTMIQNKSFKKPQLFTGLKDKKGKEIYEGDVLKYKKHKCYLMNDCTMEVCFDAECASFGYKSSISMFPDYIFPFSQHDELDNDVLKHCEIIGNIHEVQM